MSLTKLTKDLSIISKLSDEPNDTDGLTADELKAKFDEAGNSIKDYLNNTMTSELDTAIEELGEATAESYKKPDGGIPKTDLDSGVQTSLGKADTALQAGALPAGGTDGDVLVKSGATDYDAIWKKTPPQMASLATIEPTSSASKAYAAGDYLVYNGQLYKVTATSISQGETLTPGGNIQSTSVSNIFNPPAVYNQPTNTQNCTVNAGGYIKIGSIVIVNIRLTITGSRPTLNGFPRPIQNGMNTIGICGYDGQNEKTAFGYIADNGDLCIPIAYGTSGVLMISTVYIADN